MLDDNLKTQLKAYLEKVVRPIEITASVNDSAKSREMMTLLNALVELSGKITVTERSGDGERAPSFALNSPGHDIHLRFAGIPMGHEFTSLVLALLWTGGHPPRVEPEVIEQIRALDEDMNLEVYMSLSCHNCPDVVQAASLMAIYNPKIHATIVDGSLFVEEVEARQVMAVPMVFRDGAVLAAENPLPQIGLTLI